MVGVREPRQDTKDQLAEREGVNRETWNNLSGQDLLSLTLSIVAVDIVLSEKMFQSCLPRTKSLDR